MKKNGFILLWDLIALTLGLSFLTTILLAYREGLYILQKKLLLEKSIQVAEAVYFGQPNSTELTIEETETTLNANITLKEIKVAANDKVIYSLLIAK